MKLAFVAMIMICMSACKVHEQTANQSQKSEALSENQIAIHTDNVSSEDVREFAEEITERQNQNPDAIFEIVPLNKKQSGSVIASHIKDDENYPNKNFYIFIGFGSEAKNQNLQQIEWNSLYFIMNYLASNNFRVLLNVQAKASHLKAAVQDNETAVILWNSHGNDKAFYDYDSKPVPYDTLKKKGSNFYQFILSSCLGKTALKNYQYSGLRTFSWETLTTPYELKNFLVSSRWSVYDGKALSTPVKGYTCSARGSKIYSLMNVESKEYINQTYPDLNTCKEKLQSIKDGLCRGSESVVACFEP